MSQEDTSAARQILYDKLSALVEEFVSLDNNEDQTHCVATAHVLLIGLDEFDTEHSQPGGMVNLLPAGGRQPAWKTSGLLNMAKAYLEVDHYCGRDVE